MKDTVADIHARFLDGLRCVAETPGTTLPRIGAELKFPLVDSHGAAAAKETVQALWQYLGRKGWALDRDSLTGNVVGARRRGQHNETVASFETGYAKTEFSLAHVTDLFELQRSVCSLFALLRTFSEEQKVYFLGYGIHPLTPPSATLLMEKERSSFWVKAFPSNRVIPQHQGDDVHLFTVNAASHVHLSVPEQDAIRAVNVLNGFAGPQIALMANSSIWRGRVDARFKCVAEKLWDWWEPATGRAGMPPGPFTDISDYVQATAGLPPVYVRRSGKPIILRLYRTFAEYYGSDRAVGEDLEGQPVNLVPCPEDIKTHNSCCWYNARISRYYTVENRTCDQQPPESVICPAALSLGLISALDAAWEELKSFEWQDLCRARQTACELGLQGVVDGVVLRDACGRMLDLAELGLKRRGLGEQQFLDPLRKRLQYGTCPAIAGERLFLTKGIKALLKARKI